MKLYSWNVNGIRAVQKKGFVEWLESEQPDVLSVQETKAHPDQLDDALLKPTGYQTYWVSAEKKGYSGVALYTRVEPNDIKLGLGIEKFDSEGRTIIAEYDNFVFMSAYFPNGSRDHSRVPYKMEYKAAFLKYANNLREAGKAVVFAGDINTAHNEIDLARPKQNEKTTGFLREERDWIDTVIADGYIDIYRDLNPDKEGAYSWWSYRGGAREKNVGWRIDMFYISPDLRDQVVGAEIHADVMGSDHCPISIELSV